jgi:hypothetical protein
MVGFESKAQGAYLEQQSCLQDYGLRVKSEKCVKIIRKGK